MQLYVALLLGPTGVIYRHSFELQQRAHSLQLVGAQRRSRLDGAAGSFNAIPTMPEYTQNEKVGLETPTHNASLFFTLILSCFFLSGVAGLIYEILWVRMIDKVIGSAPFAVATVLSIFMGGLALGSYVAGKYIDRIPSKSNLLSLYGNGGSSYWYLRFADTPLHDHGQTDLCHSLQLPFSTFLDIPDLRLPRMLFAPHHSDVSHGGHLANPVSPLCDPPRPHRIPHRTFVRH